MKQKIIIYQLLPRLFGNSTKEIIVDGTIEENGCGKFNDLTDKVLSELKNLNISHIWLTGVLRHATKTPYPQYGLQSSHPDVVKGKAGSPYAICDYYDVDPDLAMDIPSRKDEFGQLIARIHQHGLKVIIDFVPNHVAREYRSKNKPSNIADLGENDLRNQHFSSLNNFYYFPGEPLNIRGITTSGAESYAEIPAKATGNDVFRPDPDCNDWYETVKLNYGIDYQTGQSHFQPTPDTWIKMTQILLFWSGLGVDGFRCDMAGMVPVEFWRYAISHVKSDFPLIDFIAELYEPGRYRSYLETGLFDYLYDKVGLYDTLRAILSGHSSTREISRVWQSLDGMDNSMVRFLENHDEQRIASPWFASDPWKAMPAMAITVLMNQGPVLIYAGQEIGEPASGISGFSGDDGRTTIFDYGIMPEFQKWYNEGKCNGQGLSVTQHSLRAAYDRLLWLAGNLPEVANGCFYDLMYANEDMPYCNKIFSFLRYMGSSPDEAILVAVCFDLQISSLTVRIPEHAFLSMGFGSRNYLTLNAIDPHEQPPVSSLYSQAVTVGLTVTLNSAGYGIYRIR